MLMLSNGEWSMERDRLKADAVLFFKRLYTKEQTNQDCNFMPYRGWFPQMSNDDYTFLARQINPEEIKSALFDMDPYKAHGVDGLQSFFYQKRWHFVGPSLCSMIMQFFNVRTLWYGAPNYN